MTAPGVDALLDELERRSRRNLPLGSLITGPAAAEAVRELQSRLAAAEARVARVEALRRHWQRMADTALDPENREWLTACAADLRTALAADT